MSNWQYANLVPTTTWRNAMTVPRELTVKHAGNKRYLASMPVAELNTISQNPVGWQNISVQNTFDVGSKTRKIVLPARLDLNLEKPDDFTVILANDAGEELEIGYDSKQQQYFIDRSRSGRVDFQKDFAGRAVAPRLCKTGNMDLKLVIDVSSVELFADDGLTVMTSIFFPTKPFDQLQVKTPGKVTFKKLTYTKCKSIWK